MTESDRERLTRLAQEQEKQRNEEAARKLKEEADWRQMHADSVEADKQKTEELFSYCVETFTGHKLPTGHVLNVEKVDEAKILSIGQNPDKIPYVSLYIQHCNEETGNCQGHIPMLVAWHGGEKYIGRMYFQYDRRESDLKDFGQFKNKLIDLVAGIGPDSLKDLFNYVRHRIWELRSRKELVNRQRN